MAEYPYSMSVGRMQEFIKKISSMGRPGKVTLKTLEAQGFKSTNDRTIIPALKFLGILEESGVPTDAWQALRDRENFPRVMAALVREAYQDVFTSYPEANAAEESDIRNHIAAHSKGSERMVGSMVSVFKTLCSMSDFEGELVSPEQIAAQRPTTDRLDRSTQKLSSSEVDVKQSNVAVQLNLTISENTDVKKVEEIFKYAAKYLLGREVN